MAMATTPRPSFFITMGRSGAKRSGSRLCRRLQYRQQLRPQHYLHLIHQCYVLPSRLQLCLPLLLPPPPLVPRRLRLLHHGPLAVSAHLALHRLPVAAARPPHMAPRLLPAAPHLPVAAARPPHMAPHLLLLVAARPPLVERYLSISSFKANPVGSGRPPWTVLSQRSRSSTQHVISTSLRMQLPN